VKKKGRPIHRPPLKQTMPRQGREDKIMARRKLPVFTCDNCGAMNLTRREKMEHICPQQDFWQPPPPPKVPRPQPDTIRQGRGTIARFFPRLLQHIVPE
jgi:hypothetical protein